MQKYLRTYAEVSLRAIEHNVAEARRRIGAHTKLLAVVKAEAYGHGAVRVAQDIEPQVDFFAAATGDEALALVSAGVKKPVLVLGYSSPSEYADLILGGVRMTVYSLADAQKMSEVAGRVGRDAVVHIAVDTGMTRIGFQVTEDAADEIAAIAALPGIAAEGLFTHLSCADQADKGYCAQQFAQYDHMLAMLGARNVLIPIRHVCNSAAIMEYEALEPHRYDMVRAGITNYGIYPSEEVQKEHMHLEPALAWRAHVIHVKEVEAGRAVSYGATFVTQKPVTRIATVSVGYADGYPRALSSKGRVLIRGQFAPILGRVCMDQMMVDVTDIPEVQVEDVVTLIGADGENRISVEEVADPAGRFNYEMLCTIGHRVPRVYDKA